MKKFTTIKTLLVGLCAMGATSAWAGDKTVVKYSFDDATSPSLTAGSRVSFDYNKTSVITSTKFLNAYNNANGDPGASTVSLGNTDLSGETWTLSFEWAACGGCNSKADHTTLKAGDTNLFDLTGNSNWNTTVTITYAGSDGSKTLPVPGCDKGKRFGAGTGEQYNTKAYWHNIVVTGSAEGVKMTIRNSDSGVAVVENVVLSETNVNPTSLIIEPCCGGAIGIDELSLTYYVEGEVIQTPVANYSSVDGINRTITATCESEDATIQNSTDGETWADGASITVSESGKVYFKAVKGSSESDVLEFDVVAGEAITLNAPVINRTSETSVTISADQTALLLSPTATIYYEYGSENGSFTGSKTLTVEADATITAYAEAEGYTTSATSERAVALFPTDFVMVENAPAKTSGWTANTFSTETVEASDRTYAALLLDDVQWGANVYLQTEGAWGLRASGNWYINSNEDESWLLMKDLKQGDLIVVDVDFAASDMVNATYSKYAYGARHTYEVTSDGDVELAFKKINASTMDYLRGVYSYTVNTAEVIAYTVNAVDGEGSSLKEIATGESHEGQSITVPYPKYILDGTTLKEAKNQLTTEKNYYNYIFTLSNENSSIDITYNDAINDIVFYSEAEDVEGMIKTTDEAKNVHIRCSNAAGGYAGAGENVKLTTLEPGNYKISAMVWGNSGATLQIVCGETTMNCETKGYLQQYDQVVVLTESTDVVIPAAGDGGKCFDYIYIQKLPEAVEINVDADAGYATYCSEYALYLEGIEAYTATVSGTEVTFTEQMNKTVAPGTGLLIKANGKVTLPIAAEGETVANNALIGVTKNTKVGAGNFVLMYEPYVGFFKTSDEFTVGANTAYLAAPAGARIVLPGNDATAIKAIEAEKNGEIYNLAGQRVVKAQKGLYIMNGKKVVVK